MRATSLIRALEAMASMEKGKPYALRPEDAKRRLADDLARICREAAVRPVVIDGLAVNHHGYMRVTADVDILVARGEAVALYRRLRSESGWKRYSEGFKNAELGVGLDICVEGERTAPGSKEEFLIRRSSSPWTSIHCPCQRSRNCSRSRSCRVVHGTTPTSSSC